MAIERVIKDVYRKQAFAFFYVDADGESIAAVDLQFELLTDRTSDVALVTLTIGSGIELDNEDDAKATITLSEDDLDVVAGHYWWVITDSSVPVPLAHGPFIVSEPRASAS